MMENKTERRLRLEAHPEDWFKYYFPMWCTEEPAQFHREATQRVIAHDEWFEVREWARNLGASTRSIMEMAFLLVTGKKKCLVVASHNVRTAKWHADRINDQLKRNLRLIEDYGTHKKEYEIYPGGEGQRLTGCFKENRPDMFLVIDIDTVDNCKELYIMQKRLYWLANDLLASRTAEPTLIVVAGVAYSVKGLVRLSYAYADFVSKVPIADLSGAPAWPERDSEEQLQKMLRVISTPAVTVEYYNTPVDEI